MSLGRDVRLLFLQRLFWMFGFGASTLMLIPFLTELGISNKRIGMFLSFSLVGDGLLSTLTSMFTDRVGRRRVLVLGSLLMAAKGIIFATCENFWILLLASIIGVISPSGADVGPFMAIEETAMAQLVGPESLSTVLAWYFMLGSWGSAAGTLAAGWLVQSLTSKTWSTVDAYRANFLVYFLLGMVKVIL
ncbi:hypothetical protein N7488_001506 [Penicillium malachiteum]|nr:hypothetical protein N7488_001506 [Penicillium malachiteum]